MNNLTHMQFIMVNHNMNTFKMSDITENQVISCLYANINNQDHDYDVNVCAIAEKCLQLIRKSINSLTNDEMSEDIDSVSDFDCNEETNTDSDCEKIPITIDIFNYTIRITHLFE